MRYDQTSPALADSTEDDTGMPPSFLEMSLIANAAWGSSDFSHSDFTISCLGNWNSLYLDLPTSVAPRTDYLLPLLDDLNGRIVSPRQTLVLTSLYHLMAMCASLCFIPVPACLISNKAFALPFVERDSHSGPRG